MPNDFENTHTQTRVIMRFAYWECDDVFRQTSRAGLVVKHYPIVALFDFVHNPLVKLQIGVCALCADAGPAPHGHSVSQFFKGTLGLQPGESAFFINGLHIDLDTQDIFRYA